MKLNVSDIIEATGAALKQGFPGALVRGVTIDSRKAGPGEVFFALKGPRFDGHDYIKDVFARGVEAAVVEKAVAGLPPSFSIMEVPDALRALGALARYARGLRSVQVVAISGSAGKTTTKEMIASILGVSRKVLKTEGNLNNLIGLPLTLLRLEDTDEIAVVELGISEPWEMERLVDIARPDVALITNIGRGHLKTLGSPEGVAQAKGPLFTKLCPGGVKIVNLDDPLAVRLSSGPGRKITYGLNSGADVRVKSHACEEGLGGISAVYGVRGRELAVRFSTPAASNVINGAAAIATALAFDAGLDEIKEGLAGYSPVRGRMEVLKINGFTVLDDTYNANPESVGAALRTLEKAGGRKVAVLGDMLELGQASAEEHRNVGALAGRLGIDVVAAIGEWARHTVEGAVSAGVKGPFALSFAGKKEAVEALGLILKEGDSVLVKGSRGVALEEVVEGLKGIGSPKKACG